MFTPLRKVIFIFVLTLVAGYISLPPEISVNFQRGPINLEKNIVRPGLNFDLGKISLRKNFDLVLGLDLAGGSHLVFEAQTSGLSATDRKTALESLRNVIERRVNLFGVSEPNVQISSFEGNQSKSLVKLLN